jgi:hypothetical protein
MKTIQRFIFFIINALCAGFKVIFPPPPPMGAGLAQGDYHPYEKRFSFENRHEPSEHA